MKGPQPHAWNGVENYQPAEAEMPKDPIKTTAEVYERLARSTEGMRSVVETYLRLAKSTSDAQERKKLLELAAFYAQLAERSLGQLLSFSSTSKKGANGHL
jgi:predicted solute-binding protein